jgi:hypothetical protein
VKLCHKAIRSRHPIPLCCRVRSNLCVLAEAGKGLDAHTLMSTLVGQTWVWLSRRPVEMLRSALVRSKAAVESAGEDTFLTARPNGGLAT